MSYIGNTPAEKYSSFTKQDFSTSATTSYTLSQAVANENEIALFINFVRQEPTTAYTASGTTLTLTSATSGSDDMYCVYLGKAVQTVNPPSGSVGSSQVASTIITGQTAETSIATDDTVLIHDTSAGALRKMTRANFVSGVGGANTPTFFASSSSDQAYNDSTTTKIAYTNEVFDTGNVYDASTNYRFTPGFAGKSYIAAGAWSSDNQTSIYEQRLLLYKNGSDLVHVENEQSSSREWKSSYLNLHGVFSHTDSDYFEVYGYFNTNDGGSAIFPSGSGNNAIFRNFFYGYKIIE